jgi:hypothetical protein
MRPIESHVTAPLVDQNALTSAQDRCIMSRVGQGCRGGSSMVESESSKLRTRVRFPLAAPYQKVNMREKQSFLDQIKAALDKKKGALAPDAKELESVKANFSNGPVVNRPMKKSSGRGR